MIRGKVRVGPIEVVVSSRSSPWQRWALRSNEHPSRPRTLLVDGSHGVRGLKDPDLWDVVAADGSHFVRQQITEAQMIRMGEKVGYR